MFSIFTIHNYVKCLKVSCFCTFMISFISATDAWGQWTSWTSCALVYECEFDACNVDNLCATKKRERAKIPEPGTCPSQTTVNHVEEIGCSNVEGIFEMAAMPFPCNVHLLCLCEFTYSFANVFNYLGTLSIYECYVFRFPFIVSIIHRVL